MKKVVGFAGSTSSKSINKQLVNFALNQLNDCETKLLDLNDFESELYSMDREFAGFPEKAKALWKK